MALVAGRDRVYFEFHDDQGQNAVTGVYPAAAENPASPSAALGLLFDAMRPLSVAALNQLNFACDINSNAPVAASAGAYENVEDKAVFLFLSSVGDVVKISIPAPDEGIFETDAETVDPLDEAVILFIQKVIAYAASKAGQAIIAFYKGYRSRGKTRQ